jgi:threonyl-tRNA synthetase
MLIVGDKEVEHNGISPRHRSGEDLKFMPVQQFIDSLKTACAEELHIKPA